MYHQAGLYEERSTQHSIRINWLCSLRDELALFFCRLKSRNYLYPPYSQDITFILPFRKLALFFQLTICDRGTEAQSSRDIVMPANVGIQD
jgi:hypothetical protein